MSVENKKSKEPACIFFDLGKVLVDYDFNLAYNYLKKSSSLPESEYNQRIRKIEELNIDYESGQIETRAFFQSMADTFEFNGTIDSLISAWANIFSPITKHIEIAGCLAKAYPLAIISNTSEAHIELLEAKYSFFSHFRERIYSYAVGSRKPDSEIYEHARNLMQSESSKLLFIDDRIENTNAAANLGWMTIHLNDTVDLRQELLKLGVQFP